jgi:hypothetical protein
VGWNQKGHRRKFIENAGRCHGASSDEPLRFWAEWEPESKATKIAQPFDDGPRFVHRPYYVVPESFQRLQNTDPLVFGGFYYTACQQRTRRGATQLRHLKRGSVILFGSCVGDKFAIDTVFVVESWNDHDARNFRACLIDAVPKVYFDITLEPCYSNDEDADSFRAATCGPSTQNSWRLYFGATVDNPVEGMFSFFPCMPASQCPRGFARPVIELPGAITPGLRQGKRLNRGLLPGQLTEYWKRVREKVESSGLRIGVRADMPTSGLGRVEPSNKSKAPAVARTCMI